MKKDLKEETKSLEELKNEIINYKAKARIDLIHILYNIAWGALVIMTIFITWSIVSTLINVTPDVFLKVIKIKNILYITTATVTVVFMIGNLLNCLVLCSKCSAIKEKIQILSLDNKVPATENKETIAG